MLYPAELQRQISRYIVADILPAVNEISAHFLSIIINDGKTLWYGGTNTKQLYPNL